MNNLETWNEAVLRYLSLIAGNGVSFTTLADVPHSYIGQASKFAQVNATETGLKFTSITNPMQFIGAIAIAADFPTPAQVQIGWFYRVTAPVTDNDSTKTNTGVSFVAGEEIAWNGTDWSSMGNSSLILSGGAYDLQYNDGAGNFGSSTNMTVGNPANFGMVNIKFVNTGPIPDSCAARFIGTAGWNGMQGISDYDSATDAYGVAGRYTGGGVQGNKYGGYFQSNGGLNSYGIYAEATGGTNQYAGYFSGAVNVAGAFTQSVGNTIFNNGANDNDFTIYRKTAGMAYNFNAGNDTHSFNSNYFYWNSDGTATKWFQLVGNTNDNVSYYRFDAQNNSHEMIGSILKNVGFTDTNQAITVKDGVYVLQVETGASTITIDLPAAASSSYRELVIKKIDAGVGTVVIDANGAELIDGVTTKTISTQYASFTIICDGIGWNII